MFHIYTLTDNLFASCLWSSTSELAEALPHTERPDIHLFLSMDSVAIHSHFFLNYRVPAGKAYQKEKAPCPMFYRWLNPVSLLEPIPESDSLRRKCFCFFTGSVGSNTPKIAQTCCQRQKIRSAADLQMNHLDVAMASGAYMGCWVGGTKSTDPLCACRSAFRKRLADAF